MNKQSIWTAICLTALSAVGFAQIPDYVPAEGLSAWIDFESNGEGLGLDFEIASGSINSTEDRFGELSAVKFETSEDVLITAGITSVPAGTFAYSFWAFTSLDLPVTTAIHPIHSQTFGDDADHAGSGVWLGANHFALIEHAAGYVRESVRVDGNFVGWHHYVVTYSNDAATVYVDGVVQGMSESDGRLVHAPLGSCDYYTSFGIGEGYGTSALSDYNLTVPWEGNRFEGFLDDFGTWNHELTTAEVLQLYVGGIPVLGCTDIEACNFVPSANFDDGTCISAGCNDEEACNFDASVGCDNGSCDYSCCPGPGCCDAGMHWDWEIGMCQVTNPSDSNFDGCVQLGDLLDLLGAYGDCSVLDETETVLADSVLHNGQWYGLVTIGNQVWFAENLNTAEYNNGDAIDGVCGQEEWFNGQMASQNVYGDCGLTVYDGVSDIEENEAIYGRLYNVWAVSDERGICPTGYRVSTNEDWSYIIEFLGGEDEAAAKMKTTGIWEENTGLWETSCTNLECFPNSSTNDSGLAIQPGGFRGYNGWLYAGQRRAGIFMTSTLAGPAQPVIRRLDSSPVITQSIVNQYWGASVRCVADAE